MVLWPIEEPTGASRRSDRSAPRSSASRGSCQRGGTAASVQFRGRRRLVTPEHRGHRIVIRQDNRLARVTTGELLGEAGPDQPPLAHRLGHPERDSYGELQQPVQPSPASRASRAGAGSADVRRWYLRDVRSCSGASSSGPRRHRPRVSEPVWWAPIRCPRPLRCAESVSESETWQVVPKRSPVMRCASPRFRLDRKEGQ